MIVFLGVALASPPTACDPSKDTAPLTAGGYCLNEAEYAELGLALAERKLLQAELNAAREELQAFEVWKGQHDVLLRTTVESMNAAHEHGLAHVQAACEAELAASRPATWLERHGLGIGLAAGVLGTGLAAGYLLTL